MIWDDDISFEGLWKKIDEYYGSYDIEELNLLSAPINAQYALDLIFKTLIDDKEHYPYLSCISGSVEQSNSIMLHLILEKYSKKYRKYLKKRKKERLLTARLKKKV